MDSRQSSKRRKDSNDGTLFIFAFLIGGVLTLTPIITVPFMNPESVNYPVAAAGIICGLFLLSIPTGALIYIMVKIERHADEFFNDMK